MAAHANTTGSENASDAAVPPPAAASPATAAAGTQKPKVRVAVLLPLKSAALGGAAGSVLAGIKAGYEREQDGVNLEVVETDGTPQETLKAYREVVARSDLVIGPLSRSEVAAVVPAAETPKATLVLAPADNETGALPPYMLSVGLSIEDESRQAAAWAQTVYPASKVMVVSTSAAWQKRAAKAFSAQAEILAMTAHTMEIATSDGYLNAESLVQLKRRIQALEPAMVFAALDTSQAVQLKAALGGDMPLFGTSQMNPRVLTDWKTLAPIADLEGARLLDIPWQLQSDHPAVMVYPKPLPEADRRRSADLERLYALGIDAYRIAHELAQGKRRFSIDGVTGKLSVVYGVDHPFFERILQPAAYLNGVVAPLPTDTKPDAQ